MTKVSSGLKLERSRVFGAALANLVPGGAHTYSRGADQFPLDAPNGIVRGAGCRVWDIDGNELIDWGMALGSVSLGHAEPRVNKAVIEAIGNGVNFTRPSVLELEAAKVFTATTGTDMVKFARHGSAVTTAAVKLARAFTARAKVAVPQEHPFFSFDDWFIGITESDFGIPEMLKAFTLKFSYGDLDSLEALFAANPSEIACVMMEPVKLSPPPTGYLEGVRALCDREGAVLIFDEMVTGLKWAVPGAGKYFGVKPDLSTWGKGLANGFALSALAGRREIMEVGGIERQGQRKLFLLSTTHGSESTGLAAMIATLGIFASEDVVSRNWRTGTALKERLDRVIAAHRLQNRLEIIGYPCLLALATKGPDGGDDLAFRTLFLQEVIREGVLFQGVFIVTPSHGTMEIERTAQAFDRACDVYVRALAQGSVAGLLDGPAIKPVFRKFV